MTMEAHRMAKKEAVASILADPERHRRAVVTGSSNPLHIWGHETGFVKSRYFNSKRRESEKKYKNQMEQAEKYVDENLTPGTVAGVATWSRASSDHGQSSPNNGVHPRLLSHAAGPSGGDGDGGNDGSDSGFDGLGTFDLSDSDSSLIEKNNTWSRQEHCRTRNMNALHAFSWDQRVFLPQRQGVFSSVFDLLASPRLWEKLDWTIRGSVLTILPTLILCLEPATRHIFPLPTSVVFLAYWTTQPTLGAGLRETYIFLKGFSISLVILVVIIAINPGPKWVTLVILFFCLLVTGFTAEQIKRMTAYCFASLLMQYIANPENTGYDYVGKYYATILIGQGFGLASFVFPYIRWSSENARRYIVITGDAVSLSVHGACCSFWVENSLLERQLHVVRLRQLRYTIEESTKKAREGLSEMGYEPHSGVYTARLKNRMAFLKSVFNVVQSMTLVIEQVAANPALVETPVCREFGERIRDELNRIAAAMDSIILRIVDLDSLVSVTDMTAFRLARARYEEAVSNVRDEVILSNPNYRTDNSDILLGFFLFSVEELMEIIGNFQDAAKPPSNLWYFLTFPLRDLQSSWAAFVDLYYAIRIRRSITRRLKEAIRLSVCIIVAAIFQVYAMKSSSTSPVSGVDIIPFVYRSTGGESFQYATMRMLGTVLGSLTGLLTVQIAQGHRPTLYGCTLVLTFIGSYVQAAPDYAALGNALANSVVSIVLQYLNQPDAITRIQQNCFAILIYFIVSSLVWPVRGRTKVNNGLDVSLRMAREATDRLLRNLDLPDSATAVSADVLAVLGEMQKKVTQQLSYIPGAIVEPTLDSVGFPEMPWRMLVGAQRKLLVTLQMMLRAYHTFMTSTIADAAGAANNDEKKVADNADMAGSGPAAAASISVHWVVLHRISPYTRQLSQLFYEATEVYLLMLSKATFVPTAELTRLRLGMMQCYDRIVAVYIEAIQHELNISDGSVTDASSSTSGGAKATATATTNSNNKSNMRNSSDVSAWKAHQRNSGSFRGLSGSGGPMALENVAGLVPPPASTFAPHPTTVGGAADSAGAFRNNSSMRGGLKNNTFSGGIGSGSFRRSQSGAGETRTLSKTGTGHFSYKLTPEERQRLREYVLGPNNAALTNASFFATAAALAAASEQGGATTAASRRLTNVNASASCNSGGGGGADDNNAVPSPTTNAATTAAPNSKTNNHNTVGTNLTNQTFAGGFLSNHSMSSTAGSFWNHNVSMLDPALLRNAGIVVQEPVHEEPHQRRDDNESGGAHSSHHSLRNSIRPHSGDGSGGVAGNHRGRRPSSVGGGTGSDAPNAADLDALPGRTGEGNDSSSKNTGELHALSGRLPMRSDGDSGTTVPSAQRNHGSTSPGGLHSSPSPPQPPPFTGRSQASLPLSSQDPSLAHQGAGLGVKRSKTAKYAVPSVLQMSTVLPAGDYALRNPEATTTSHSPPTSLSVGNAVTSASPLDLSASAHSGGGGQTGSPAATSTSQLAHSSSATLAPNSNPSFVSSGAGTAAAAAGDVFSLGRTARTSVRPANWSNAGLTGGAHRSAKEEHEKQERVPHFSEESLHNELSPGGWDRGGGSKSSGGEGGQRYHHHHRRSSRAVSDAPLATPSKACHSAEEVDAMCGGGGDGGVADGQAELMSRDSHEPFEVEMRTSQHAPDRSLDREIRQGEPLDAVVSGLLSDPLQLHTHGATHTTVSPAAPDNLLPTPIPAPVAGDKRAPSNCATHPFFNNSFTTTGGPAIPDTLRAYVEGLAEQQRQQVPPPPAVLGNVSFINLATPLPVGNRSFLCGGNTSTATSSTNVFNGTFAGLGSTSNTMPPNSGTLSRGNITTSAPATPAAPGTNAGNAAGPPSAAAAISSEMQADCMPAVSKLELNSGTFCRSSRGNDRSGVSGGDGEGGEKGRGAALLSLLEDGGGDGSDGGEEYVLTNSDIHSLEAFLFGLRAVIMHVEELERYLLEVIHGNEMAAKL
jgi:hypothetical protein